MTAPNDDRPTSQRGLHAGGAVEPDCCAPAPSAQAPQTARHPLDPLDGPELERAAALIVAAFGKDEPVRFERIELNEPDKAALRRPSPGGAVDRQARFSIFRRGRVGVTEGILSLDQGRVLTSRHLTQARPMIMLEEFLEVEAAVKANPAFIAACRRRGITDISQVCVGPCADPGERMRQTPAFLAGDIERPGRPRVDANLR